MRFIKTIWLIFLMVGMLNNSYADVYWEDSFRYNGFVTQGYINSSDNNFFGDSTDGSFEFSEVGVNASVKPSTQLLLSWQVLMRNAGDMYDADPIIDYALADYTLMNTSNALLSLSVGRFKNPAGFLNDTRDVAFTRTSTFLPQVIYFDQVRNAFLSSDGVLFNLDMNNGIGNFKLQIGFGKILEDKNIELVYLANDWEGNLSNIKESTVARLVYESPDQRIRFALSALLIDLKFNAGITDPIGSGVIGVEYYIASIEYNAEDWWVTMEYGQEPVQYKDFGSFIPDNKKILEGYYLQANYRFEPNASVHLRYERGYLDKNDKYGKNAEVNTGLPGYFQYALGWSTGVRWDINENWLMMLDYQKVEGALYLSPADNLNKFILEKNWDMFNLLVSYRF